MGTPPPPRWAGGDHLFLQLCLTRSPLTAARVPACQVDAMELNSLDMPALLAELGANYDPERLAEALRSRPWDLRKRALRIAATLGAFLTSLLQVNRAASSRGRWRLFDWGALAPGLAPGSRV